MRESDLDSMSGFDEGKITYDEHDDLVRDVRAISIRDILRSN